jgi:hypothetical protein
MFAIPCLFIAHLHFMYRIIESVQKMHFKWNSKKIGFTTSIKKLWDTYSSVVVFVHQNFSGSNNLMQFQIGCCDV